MGVLTSSRVRVLTDTMPSAEPGGYMRRRREFLSAIAASAALWPRTSAAQTHPKRPVIGFLTPGTKATGRGFFDSFFQGMRELGYLERRDYGVEERFAEGNLGRLQSLAEELIRLRPDVIVAGASVAALAVKKATSSIPIVGANLTDPVRMGLAASESHPGTNVTGTLIRLEGLTGKQLEIARELVPAATKAGIMVNPTNPNRFIHTRELETAAAKLGVSLAKADVRSTGDVEAAFQDFVRAGVEIAVVASDATFIAARRSIATFALATRIPTAFAHREHVEVGGLVSYGINLSMNYRRAAYYVDKILKGDKPANLPFEFPAKLELVLNTATAKALGLTIPPTLLARADEVLE
jgi:putative tryptophan/tyrosine transport system substrate-binding protein